MSTLLLRMQTGHCCSSSVHKAPAVSGEAPRSLLAASNLSPAAVRTMKALTVGQVPGPLPAFPQPTSGTLACTDSLRGAWPLGEGWTQVPVQLDLLH